MIITATSLWIVLHALVQIARNFAPVLALIGVLAVWRYGLGRGWVK